MSKWLVTMSTGKISAPSSYANIQHLHLYQTVAEFKGESPTKQELEKISEYSKPEFEKGHMAILFMQKLAD